MSDTSCVEPEGGDASSLNGVPVPATSAAGTVLTRGGDGKSLEWDMPAAGVSLASTTPAAIGTAAVGVGTTAARADHVHDHGNQLGGSLHADVISAGSSGFMSGTDKAKLDGVAAGATALALSSTTPAAVGTGAVGVGTTAARADHVHDHGNQAGGSLHALAVAAGAAGFLSGTDKTKLNALPAALALPVSQANGGTGVDLSNATANQVLAGPDGSSGALLLRALLLRDLPPPIVTKYTTAGTYTWTKAAGTRLVFVVLTGGGGGGGSGRQGAAATSGGGSGGGGGGMSFGLFVASDLAATVQVKVGAGGAGGAAQASASSDGRNGTLGNASMFGSGNTGYIEAAGNNTNGLGGSTSNVSGGSAGLAMFQGNAGGAGNINTDGTSANAAGAISGVGSGGGGGGGGAKASSFSNGGAGGNYISTAAFLLNGGSTQGGSGSAGRTVTLLPFGGTGGGGGASGDSAGSVTGGAGGAGGAPGGGGGGGGGSVNGASSGAGGNGADGAVWVSEF